MIITQFFNTHDCFVHACSEHKKLCILSIDIVDQLFWSYKVEFDRTVSNKFTPIAKEVDRYMF